MKLDPVVPKKIVRDALLSLLIYAAPVALMIIALSLTGERPWDKQFVHVLSPVDRLVGGYNAYGSAMFFLVLGIFEFSMGLYGIRWNRNEKLLDLVSFAASRLVLRPLTAYFTLKILPLVFPNVKGTLQWVPFFWGFLVICVADDLTQYWYHRLHHQIPWLWRFHRAHHSAPYMGVTVTYRQNLFYTIFFSQIYVTATLVYLGLGVPALFVAAIKNIITVMAHSSAPWDRALYRHKPLHPIAWLLERLISTPATHHAHHAATHGDGVGYYKGNFGNMFFLWDVIFGTAFISRQYPERYGVSHYEGDAWYAQFLWPVMKSSVDGSELAAGGPLVREDEPEPVTSSAS